MLSLCLHAYALQPEQLAGSGLSGRHDAGCGPPGRLLDVAPAQRAGISPDAADEIEIISGAQATLNASLTLAVGTRGYEAILADAEMPSSPPQPHAAALRQH